MKCDACQEEKEEGKDYTYYYENGKIIENRTHWICNKCVIKQGYSTFFGYAMISIPWFIINWWLYASEIMETLIGNKALFGRLIALLYMISVGGSILLFISGCIAAFKGVDNLNGTDRAKSIDKNFLQTNNFVGKSKSILLTDLTKRLKENAIHNRFEKILEDSDKILMIESENEFAKTMRSHAISKIK